MLLSCKSHSNNLFHILFSVSSKKLAESLEAERKLPLPLRSSVAHWVQRQQRNNEQKEKKWSRSLSLDSVWCLRRKKNAHHWQPVWFVLRAWIFSCNFHVRIFPRPRNDRHIQQTHTNFSYFAYKCVLCVCASINVLIMCTETNRFQIAMETEQMEFCSGIKNAQSNWNVSRIKWKHGAVFCFSFGITIELQRSHGLYGTVSKQTEQKKIESEEK